MRCLLITVFIASLAGSLTAQDSVVNRKLSGPMVSGIVDDVEDLLISPSGEQVLYTVSRGTEVAEDGEVTHLAVARTDGSTPAIQLTSALGPSIEFMRWTPDETRAVFVRWVSSGVFLRYELLSVLVDGSAAPTVLFSNAPAESLVEGLGFDRTLQLTADSHVIHLRSASGLERAELYSIPAGGGVAVRLSGPLDDVNDLAVSGPTVVYSAVEGIGFDLYAVPADGSATRINLTNVATSADGVRPGFVVDPTGTRVVFQSARPSRPLFSVPLDGSAAPVPLSPILPSGQQVTAFRVSPDGAHVVYRADQTADNDDELFIAPIDASGPTEPLAGTPADDEVHANYAFSPDGAYVVYQMVAVASGRGLFSVRTSDGAVVQLHSNVVRDFRISQSAARVVFLASDRELFSAPIDGASAAVRINPDFVGGGEVFGEDFVYSAYAVTPDSQHVVYIADAEVDRYNELYRVEIEPSGAPVATQLNGPLPTGGDVEQFRILPDSASVLYSADERTNGITELFRAPDGIVLSDPPLSPVGDVSTFVARNGRVVYLADQDVDTRVELFGAPIDGGAAPIVLSGALVSGGDVLAVALSPDGSTAVYRADAEVDGRDELFTVPSDGSAPPVKLNTALTVGTVQNFGISPDGTRVVYVADQTSAPGLRLHAVPIQGGATVALGFAGPFQFTPDSAHVVFVDEGLYAVPIDGSSQPTFLSDSFTSIQQFTSTPDGQRIVFRADGHLLCSPVHGGVLLDLSGALVSGAPGTVQRFELSADGSRAVYLSDRITDDRFVLSSVPVDGSSGSVVLNGPMAGGGDVLEFHASPVGTDVLYLADQVENAVPRLHRVPVDGSAPDVLLSNLELSDTDFQVAPDGAHVVMADGGQLFSLRVTGGSWKLISHDNGAFAFGAGGRRVIHNESGRLVMTPTDGGPSLPLSPDTGTVLSFLLDGPRVVYRADQDESNVVELYSSRLERAAEQPLPVESASVVR